MHVHDTSAERKTAENLLQLMIQEKDYIEMELDLKLIGWVSDAGGDSRAARTRFLAMFPWLLVVDCFAHQVRVLEIIPINVELSLLFRCNSCLRIISKRTPIPLNASPKQLT